MTTNTLLADTVSCSEKRRHERRPQKLKAEIFTGPWPLTCRVPASIVDAGERGLGLEPKTKFTADAGTPVTVRWTAPAALTGLRAGTPALMRGEVAHNDGRGCCGIRLRRLVREEIENERNRRHRLLAVIAVACLMVLVSLLKTRNVVSFWYSPFIQVYSLATAFYVLSRIVLSLFYREPADRGLLKSVSIIISVKNEETHIAKTIAQCFGFNYPPELVEVIVIDDGSTDRTWKAMNRVKNDYPSLRLFRFEKNRGKRHGMALGARRAKGEILVFMDSDVIVDPEGLYRIVQPFADPLVGAVAGHTRVIIQKDNIISKMESVRYFVSQRVMKAAESMFDMVTCCPGPFSAYRRYAVMDVVDDWLGQTFLGAKATFGDDRSLTNYILRKFKVVYHAGAWCSTYVPQTWPVFIRQQLRWKKSWIRETTIAGRFMVKEHPFGALLYYLGVVISLASPLVMLRAFIYAPVFLASQAFLPYIGGLFLVFLLLGLIYYYHTGSRYWYYGLLFAVVYSWFFSLQTYYAILAVRQNQWGTR